MIDRLRALTGENPPADEWTSAALIRLLAAEQQWLRLPPLHFQVGTDLLSQVCVSELGAADRAALAAGSGPHGDVARRFRSGWSSYSPGCWPRRETRRS